jgi:hypothetical protein
MAMEWSNSSFNCMSKHVKKVKEILVEKENNIRKQDDKIATLN